MLKLARPMELRTIDDRRRGERRRRDARCSYRAFRRAGHDACQSAAQWRCTGCGRYGCPRHRIHLENPEMCSFCTGQIVGFVERSERCRRT